MLDLLTGHAAELGLQLPRGALTDPEALAAIARIGRRQPPTRNPHVRQINRIAAINNFTTVTPDLVDTARESLIIGAT